MAVLRRKKRTDVTVAYLDSKTSAKIGYAKDPDVIHRK